jgi:hypothetical protein
MALPELRVVAEGETSRGEHWYLSAGGTADDYYTMLKTVHPDGRWDEGGMGGPPLYAGQLLNAYTGRAGDGPLRLIVRADPRVRRLRVQLADGESRELPLAAADLVVGVTFFAALLPGIRAVDAIQAFDLFGRPLLD